MKCYGGFKSIFSSPCVYLSIFLSLVSHKYFFEDWFEIPINMIPNILGFTLGGYAIALTFGGTKFLDIITIKLNSDETTPFMEFNGTFSHFIIIQIVTLVYALVFKAITPNSIIFAFFGVTLLYYTILTALLCTFAILNLSQGYQDFKNNEKVCKNCYEGNHKSSRSCRHCGSIYISTWRRKQGRTLAKPPQ